MKLSTWIIEQKRAVASCAREVGLVGKNPAKTFDRYVKGERPVDAEMVAAIETLTNGAVTAQDMHETRLEWLKANRPEKFVALEIKTEHAVQP